MRLSTIKLAGFKSFVDPTVLHLPTNLTGICGPNGCGKSNIIDAIRWVMGESAASRLRGEAITDVIFSGSSGRKPVGQATVELIFDNSDATLGGEYATFNEVSVKRTVGRDAQSDYYLNGVRCRRRDITDLFLGTGLGARSYSIIEQGVISEIVESRPEQLRIHLEEAAGVSRYKERRKETESRIKATRENLDRVKDVREEVEKQLDHLNRQARAAERWKKLKEERALREAELRGLNYRAVNAQLETQRHARQEAETALEGKLAAQRHLEAEIEQGRVAHQEHTEAMNGVQAEVYQVGAELARVEQQIKHHREMLERLQQDREESERTWTELADHIQSDTAQRDELQTAVAAAEPEAGRLHEADTQAAQALTEAEAAHAAWQQRWEAHSGQSATTSREAEVERTHIDHLDRQALDLSRRREALRNERKNYDLDALASASAGLIDQHAAHKTLVDTHSANLEKHKAEAERLQGEERQTQSALAEANTQRQSLRGRIASLEALQRAALGRDRDAARDWLQKAGLAGSERLGAKLDVASGWERAVETVLAGMLEGVLVDDPATLAGELAELAGADITLVGSADALVGDVAGTLAAEVKGPAAARALLAQVRTAATLDEARSIAATLAPAHTVITRDGVWLGPGFARVRRAEGGQVGVLARERELQEATTELAAVEKRIAELQEHQAEVRDQRRVAEQARDDAQRDLYGAHRRLSELAGEMQSRQGRIDSAKARLAAIDAELADIETRLAENEQLLQAARGRMQAAVANMGEHEQARVALEGERRQLLEHREAARADAQEASDAAHRHAIALESRRVTLAALEQSLGRMHAQREQLSKHRSDLDARLAAGGDPIAALEKERQTCLDQRLSVDRKMVEARRRLEDAANALQEREQARHAAEQAMAGERDTLEKLRLEEQGHRLRAEQLAEAIREAGLEIEPLLASLSDEVQPEAWQEKIADLDARITRLEPVNLAAISEHAEAAQRKEYLDAQMTDLTTALETLENAIRKIDRETRERFKDTFDRVNSGFQSLFPKLFGGGHAYLELTGEDLLDAGVTMMARPPGKRNSHISLLSGGEKAMTAMALVMAIFNLNPAPFCLLDEVDAPMDEGNVGRFGQLVRDMSEKVQFLVVTHNKATMEMTHQLCGVTMREPGVSRLVQVDLAEATRLAGVAA
ncbi:MAG: chromosome segregation protein SMC [Rhodanobacteraceae bacterium]|nr:MAG: chromosome segregation protein SMC [Rhodanobacteraceae bacterium]